MKPAIFNTDMVRAILDGRKTQTRRIIDKRYNIQHLSELNAQGDKNIYPFQIIDNKTLNVYDTQDIFGCFNHYLKSPYKKGDIIYVRETFVVGIPDGTMPESDENPITVFYKADDSVHGWIDEYEEECNIPWKPSIHMTKEYARLFLRVKDVRIERLNEISEEDAIAEGIKHLGGGQIADTGDYFETYYYHGDLIDAPNDGWGYENTLFEWADEAFASLWESIYGKDSFNDDYVWVIEFEKISKEEAING
jgi:hypothetical protein